MNRDVTYYFEEEDLDQDLPKQLPIRKHCNKKGRIEHGEKYYDHYDREFFQKLDRFLDNSVGKDFDDTFHDFCQKFPKVIGGVNTRSKFLERFKPEYLGWRYYGQYDVDENNIIVRDGGDKYAPRHKQSVTIPLTPESDIKEYIEVSDARYIINNEPLSQFLYEKLGYDDYWSLLNESKLPVNFFSKRGITFNDINNVIGKLPVRVYADKLFPTIQYGKWSTIIEGTREWDRYQYEKRDQTRKWWREYQEEREEEKSKMLINEESKRKTYDE